MNHCYDQRFQSQMDSGASRLCAAEEVARADLDGKPALRGKHKVTWAERHADDWASDFLCDVCHMPTEGKDGKTKPASCASNNRALGKSAQLPGRIKACLAVPPRTRTMTSDLAP